MFGGISIRKMVSLHSRQFECDGMPERQDVASSRDGDVNNSFASRRTIGHVTQFERAEPHDAMQRIYYPVCACFRWLASVGLERRGEPIAPRCRGASRVLHITCICRPGGMSCCLLVNRKSMHSLLRTHLYGSFSALFRYERHPSRQKASASSGAKCVCCVFVAVESCACVGGQACV